MFNEPACWDFHFAVRLVVVGNVGIVLLQSFKLRLVDDRILKETARAIVVAEA